MQNNRETPVGIKIVCVLLILRGAGTIYSFAMDLPYLPKLLLPWYGPIYLIFPVIGFADFFMAYGLWNLRGWGWKLTIGVYGINLAISLIRTVVLDTMAIIDVFLIIIILGYVYSKKDLYR